MRIAIPTEVKDSEFRVAITPAGVHELTRAGHRVHVQRGAGVGSSISDADYVDAGAVLEDDAESTWDAAELVLKVKEPTSQEYRHFRPDLLLFTFLHLAAEERLTSAIVDSGMTAIAYETVQLQDRSLPLLAPMSEVAGRLAPIVGANTLLKPSGGPGLLLPGVPGTHPANVTVLGGGTAGSGAIHVAQGLGARVTVLDTDLARLRSLDAQYRGTVTTIASNTWEIERSLLEADLVIGSVLVPGARTPKLVSDDLVRRMRPGSVLVDIAVDQGGCFEGSRPTTHAAPTFPVHDSLYYCVSNMPGAVPHTSTHALTNATLPYVRRIADSGWKEALRREPSLAAGLNAHAGVLTNAAVAEAHGCSHVSPASVLE